MEIWVQYTLDLEDKPEKGTLILGGWATNEICYKFIPEGKKCSHAGSTEATPVNETPGDYFDKEIRRAMSQKRLLNETHRGKMIYSDDYLFVYAIIESESIYEDVEDEEKLIGLALFVRTIPIHLPGAFKDYLREIGLFPSPETEEDDRDTSTETDDASFEANPIKRAEAETKAARAAFTSAQAAAGGTDAAADA